MNKLKELENFIISSDSTGKEKDRVYKVTILALCAVATLLTLLYVIGEKKEESVIINGSPEVYAPHLEINEDYGSYDFLVSRLEDLAIEGERIPISTNIHPCNIKGHSSSEEELDVKVSTYDTCAHFVEYKDGGLVIVDKNYGYEKVMDFVK